MNLSIKNVPDDLAELLRQRAMTHHRSMQGELMAILEGALRPRRRLSAAEVHERVRRLGLATPEEATAMIRANRDRR